MDGSVRPGSRVAAVVAVGLATLCCTLATNATPARAAACELSSSPLYDSANFEWDLSALARVHDGGYDPGHDGAFGANDRPDAFDNISEAAFDPNPPSSFTEYNNPDANGCTSALGGREIIYPADTTTVPGLSIVRKVYVPASGTPFMRILDEVTHTASDDTSFQYRWGSVGDLGSDGPPAPEGTVVLASSSGDTQVDTDDGWVATAQADTAAAGNALTCDPGGDSTSCDPPVATIWDGTAPDALLVTTANDVAPTGTGANPDTVGAGYVPFTLIQEGTTGIFMHVIAQRLTTADAVSAASSLGAGPAEVFAGMTDDDCQTLINWACRKAPPGPGPSQQTTPQTPQSPSVTPPAAFGGIALGSQTLKVKNGKVTVTVSCPAGAVGNCVGTDTLSTANKVVVAAAAMRKKKVLKLGKAKFTIAPGKKGKVTIKLNKTARRLLANKRTLRAKQKIVAHDSRNVNKTTVSNLKLKAAKKPRAKH